MSDIGCSLSTEEVNGGKRFKRAIVVDGGPVTTSRRLLFSLPSLSTTTDVPIFFGPQPQFSRPRLIRSRRLKDRPPKKQKRIAVVAGSSASVPILHLTGHLQSLDSGVPLSLYNCTNVRLQKDSTKGSCKKRRLKGCSSTSRSGMQEDVQMLMRLAKIPTDVWQLPHKDPCHHCKAIRFAYEPPGFCCASGKIELQLPKMPDELWNLYVSDMTALGVEFRRRCRTYNNSMAFTSIKMTYDETLAKANRGVYTFKVHGVVRHYIHELMPKDGVPRHLQLYFYGTERDLENRVCQSGGLDYTIISLLVNILKNNPYHNFFTNLQNMPDLDTYAIVLRANPKLDERVYNLPVVDHVAAIWNEGIGPSLEQPRDIKVSLRSGGVRYVHYYYGCYDPLQYCLIFPYGESGWYAGIPKKASIDLTLEPMGEHIEDFENDTIDPHMHGEADTLLAAEQSNLQRNFKKPSSVAMREYYCYLFQIRTDDRTNILRTGRVIQQFQIDTYVKIETQRLDFLRHNQSRSEMRTESYQGLFGS